MEVRLVSKLPNFAGGAGLTLAMELLLLNLTIVFGSFFELTACQNYTMHVNVWLVQKVAPNSIIHLESTSIPVPLHKYNSKWRCCQTFLNFQGRKASNSVHPFMPLSYAWPCRSWQASYPSKTSMVLKSGNIPDEPLLSRGFVKIKRLLLTIKKIQD